MSQSHTNQKYTLRTMPPAAAQSIAKTIQEWEVVEIELDRALDEIEKEK